MGWSGGTDIACRVASVLQECVSDGAVRAKIYAALVDALRDKDWDCEYEVEGIDPALDENLDLEEDE